MALSGATGIEIPLRLIELHWAYIALYMEIDRGLLALLEGGRLAAPDSLAELEADADRVFGDYMRVMQARGRLDSALASLGGDEFAMWELITEVTKFQPLVDGVDLKVKVLARSERAAGGAGGGWSDRETSSILSGLTALTVVTVAVALIGNFVGTHLTSSGISGCGRGGIVRSCWWRELSTGRRSAIIGTQCALGAAGAARSTGPTGGGSPGAERDESG